VNAPTQVTHTELNAAAGAVLSLYNCDRDLIKRSLSWDKAFGLDYEGAYWVQAPSGLAARAPAIGRQLFLPVPMFGAGVTVSRFRARMKRGGVSNVGLDLYTVALSTGVHTSIGAVSTSGGLYETLDSGPLAHLMSASNALVLHAVASNIGDEFAGAIVEFTVAP
jgi:hypothetical protein